MHQSHTVSQLTLIKTFSCNSDYTVHTNINRKKYVFDIKVEPFTTVQSAIEQSIVLLKQQNDNLAVTLSDYRLELYAARKNGRKISDFPSFQAQQKIIKTGQKCFFLLIQQKQTAANSKSNTISTKSIRSDMKPLQIKKRQNHIEKEKGCFCFS